MNFLDLGSSFSVTDAQGSGRLNLRRRYLASILLVLSQASASPQPPAASGSNSSAAGVPIELSRRFGLILVKAEVNDRPATLVMDTGCSHTILSTKLLSGQFSNPEHAANPSKGSGWVGDANWIKATVKVGDIVWNDHKFLAMDDLPDISDSVGQKIDGILGEDVLQEFSVIRIDFSHRQLTLSH